MGRWGPDLSFRGHQVPQTPKYQPESHLPGSPKFPNQSIWATQEDDGYDGDDNDNGNGKAGVDCAETTISQDQVAPAKSVKKPAFTYGDCSLLPGSLHRSINRDVVVRMMRGPNHNWRSKQIPRHPHNQPDRERGPANGWRKHQQPRGSQRKPKSKTARKGCKPEKHQSRTNGDDRDDDDSSAPLLKRVRTNSSDYGSSKQDLRAEKDESTKPVQNEESASTTAPAGTPSTDAVVNHTVPMRAGTDSTEERTRGKIGNELCAYVIPTPCSACIALGLSGSISAPDSINGTKRKRPECVEVF